MKPRNITNALLLIIAVFLGVLALSPGSTPEAWAKGSGVRWSRVKFAGLTLRGGISLFVDTATDQVYRCYLTKDKPYCVAPRKIAVKK